MKKYLYPIILIFFCMLCLNVFAETPYLFKYEKSGHGKKSIIFIPGFACSGDVWMETRLAFEENYTCYTLTMAGFAGIAPQQASSFQNWSKSIAEFISANKIVRPVLIGHSLGGALAMDLASKYPDLIDRIVVVDALPCLAAMMNPEFKSKTDPDCSEIHKQMMISDEDFYKSQKRFISSMVADTTKHETIIDWSMKSDRKTCAEIYCDFSNTDLRETIKTISCPSLILLESYFINFKDVIQKQYVNLENVQFQYANKGLHFIMFDDTKWYMNQLQSFIQ